MHNVKTNTIWHLVNEINRDVMFSLSYAHLVFLNQSCNLKKKLLYFHVFIKFLSLRIFLL